MQAEWILLVIVAALLISKLISVLGREERPPEKLRFVAPSTGQILEMTLLQQKEDMSKDKGRDEFDEKDFLMGAKMAFNAVVEGFAAGNTQMLKPLLSDHVYDAFVQEINKRKNLEQVMDFSLVSINSSKIVSKSEGKNPKKITVEFVTEQINVLKDKLGVVLEGDPILISKVLDVWTFERDTKSRRNWIVTATKSEALHAYIAVLWTTFVCVSRLLGIAG